MDKISLKCITGEFHTCGISDLTTRFVEEPTAENYFGPESPCRSRPRGTCEFLDTPDGPCRMICDTIPTDLDSSSTGLEVLVSLSEIQPLSEVRRDPLFCIGELSSVGKDFCTKEETTDQIDSKCGQSDSKSKKKKGGWPKGKRRKVDASNFNAPKAPTSGYVLFLNERRRFYKESHPDVPFADVTKVLGNEWTKLLAAGEKRKYLDLAAADKKRYREELAAYRQISKKKHQKLIKEAIDSSPSEPCSELTIDLGTDDEDANELYCKTCDQLFTSMHNKKEHLYGRQHLQAMTMCKASSVDERRPDSFESPTSDPLYMRLTGSGVSGTSGSSRSTSSTVAASNVNQAIHDFFEITLAIGVLNSERKVFYAFQERRLRFLRSLRMVRELLNKIYDSATSGRGRVVEIRELNVRLAEWKKEKERLQLTMNGLKLLESSLRTSLKSLKTEELGLKEQLENLRMVPALFGVISFQHQT